MELWYTQPAVDWNAALPAGNGRLGCMQFGGVARERFQLNEDSLWRRRPYAPPEPRRLGHAAQSPRTAPPKAACPMPNGSRWMGWPRPRAACVHTSLWVI